MLMHIFPIIARDFCVAHILALNLLPLDGQTKGASLMV